MRTILLGVAVGLLSIGAAQADRAKQVRYIGVHPIAKSAGGGFCYIEGPHVHLFAADKVQYRDHHGHHHFVGDPVAYGYDGPKFAYKGHHPIHVDAVLHVEEPDLEFCYLDGAHYHYFEPPEASVGPEFKLVGDAYFYVAEPPPLYLEARPAMIAINATYRPLVYARPVVTVEAPVGWIGARAELMPPVVVAPSAGAVVAAPGVGVGVGVGVHIPVPSVKLQVGIGLPGVVVHEHHHHHKHHKHKHKHKKHKGR